VPLLRETLPDGTSYQLLEAGESRFDTMAEVTVPKGHVFVLGDSRNNAADSRLPQDIGGRGFAPVETLIGVFEAN
jgi:signal peptidase I